MPLQPGARLGPYEVLSALGAGGMGEVWRARDSRLDRDVALKVLPEAFVADPERLSRFQREAKVLASLNHPNIGGIHGVEEADRVNALVLELVEGPTLADRITRGPVPLDEALPIARQIAEALEAAHEQGIIHRDLKPANIKVRPDGTVKVLDFGLAKALEPQPQAAVASADLSHSPTLTLGAATQMGAILGTAAYMAPEQARGRPVDKRADVWALGCVLYEMLTGRRAFGGDDVTDTLASVVRADPDWRALPAETPSGVRRLLRRMLRKDPRERVRDAGDARLELDDALANHGETGRDETSPALPRRWWLRLPALAMLAVLSLALAAVAGRWLARPAPQPAPMAQFALLLPGEPLSSPAISPDGKNLAIVIGDGTHQAGLWVRPLGSLLWREVAGGVDPYKDVFWSPDSAFVAFWKGHRLMKVSLDGAPEQEIASLGSNLFGGGAWSLDGTFLLVGQDGLLSRVAASGGAASPVLQIDATPGSGVGSSPFLPQLLPDGERFLYYRQQADGTTVDTYLGSLNGSAARFLEGRPGSPHVALYAEPGYLLYAQDRNLMAQRLDEERLTPVGGPVSLGLPVRGLSIGSLAASVSADGTLVTASFDAESALAWVDRRGAELRRFEPTGRYMDLSLSPDGSWLTLNQGVDQQDLWRMDLDRGTLTRLTSSAEVDWVTSWSPDGRTLAFTRGFDLYTMPADGSAAPTLLRENDELTWALDWSSNGRLLVCQRFSRAGGVDVVVIDVEDPRSVTPVIESRFNEEQPRFSPDAEWIAYTSDASGRREVYVRPLVPGGAERVSTRGGAYPQWRRDGRELYYTAPDRWLMAVDVDWSRTPPHFGQPRALFETRHPRRSGAGSDYVPSIDGQRFLVKVPAGPSSSPTLVVTLNWPALLEP